VAAIFIAFAKALLTDRLSGLATLLPQQSQKRCQVHGVRTEGAYRGRALQEGLTAAPALTYCRQKQQNEQCSLEVFKHSGHLVLYTKQTRTYTVLVTKCLLPDIMVRAAWVLVVMVAVVVLMGLCHVSRLKAFWDFTWMVEIANFLLPGLPTAALCLFVCLGQGHTLSQTSPCLRVPCCAAVGFLGFVLGTFVYSMWLRLLKPLVGPTSRWRQQTSSLLVLLMFAAVVFPAHRRLSAPDSIHEQGVILPSWSGREPTLLARLHPCSSLTSWVGPETLPDFLAGQSSPRVMLRITDDLHAHSDDLQCESTAMAVGSGLLEVAPTLSASTLGRFQPPGPSDSHFGRTCQACCKPHDLQQQQPQLRRSCDLQFRTLALPSPYSLAPSDHIGTYLASRSLSTQQLLLRQAEYAYAISVFRFAGLDMNIRHSQGQYAAQCLSAWRGQRTSLVQQLQGFFMAPLNDTRAANSQQQLPGMSGLVLNSMTSSPSAWVWFQTPRLATSAGRLSI